MAQSAVHRCEAECSGLQDHNQSLSHQLARSASNLTIAHTRLRYTHMAGSANTYVAGSSNTCQKLTHAGSMQRIYECCSLACTLC